MVLERFVAIQIDAEASISEGGNDKSINARMRNTVNRWLLYS
jgi:hypothetical protein